MNISRKNFIKASLASSAGLLIPSLVWAAKPAFVQADPIDPAITREFVLKAHTDFSVVKSMLEEYPHLLNATVDWRDGDFESAIGAMAHMGYVDQVHFMIEKGARFDIFVLALLGKTEMVKSMLDLYPNLLNAIGPHGFTLLHHAKLGGKDATELYEYFKSKGLTQERIKFFKE